ncbi:DUF488 family protein [Marinilabilia sp.]|uniref:DUF488 domain-containing protein n=1 Tax=Marinilabilia sp. TaxID=2021252 RepID=UPI0025C15E51|nr:DUF488 domain-containing protein [Marinilabilia sp.]
MFYRRKIVLALIELLGGDIEKLQLQKLLFLYSQRKPSAEYDFVPYKYGCYSFSAKADLNTMVKRDFLGEEENRYNILDQTSYLKSIKTSDQKLLQEVVETYGGMNNNQLIKHTYINFPWYAIRSTIARNILPEKLYERLDNALPQQTEPTLFTIGYEGISLENYLNKLLKNNVKLLVDVRKNPLSMKFGFSKTLLKRYTSSVGIDYLHIPEVGIESSKRQKLETQADYDSLFADYRATTLKNTANNQKYIIELINQYHRIALTCFEANHCQCHRTHLANSVGEFEEFYYPIIHL